MRRFMQTFVLVPQSPKKYYVHNDIFRYQDEVFHDNDTDTENQEDVIGIYLFMNLVDATAKVSSGLLWKDLGEKVKDQEFFFPLNIQPVVSASLLLN